MENVYSFPGQYSPKTSLNPQKVPEFKDFSRFRTGPQIVQEFVVLQKPQTLAQILAEFGDS